MGRLPQPDYWDVVLAYDLPWLLRWLPVLIIGIITYQNRAYLERWLNNRHGGLSYSNRQGGLLYWLVRPCDDPVVRRRFYLGIVIAVFAAFLRHRFVYGMPVFPMDDAYIVSHNAQVVLSGHDPNYPGSSPLTGTTSTIHLALVTLLSLELPSLWAIYLVAWLAILAYALGLARLAFVHGASILQAALVTLIGLFVSETPHQLLNGLETGLMLAVVTWALALVSERSTERHKLLAILCGLLPFIRPELALVSVLLLAVEGRRLWQGAESSKAALRLLVTDVGIALLCAAPWALWCQLSLGHPFPTTISAKQYYFAQAGLPAHMKLGLVEEGLGGFALDLGALSLCVLMLILTPTGRGALVFCGVMVAAYYAQFPGALKTYEYRYLYPLLPFLLYGAASCFNRPHKPIKALATLLLAVCWLQTVNTMDARWKWHLICCDYTAHHLRGVAAWCNRNLPPGSTLLIHDAGYIAYGTHFRLVDLVGLKTPGSIAYHKTLTYPSNGRLRCEAISRIALSTHPDYLVILWNWEHGYGIADGLIARGWKVQKLNDQYAFWIYRLTPPDHPTSVASSGALPKSYWCIPGVSTSLIPEWDQR